MYWDYDVVHLVDGCGKSDLLYHTLVFPKVQEVLFRHVMTYCAFHVVAARELYSCEINTGTVKV